MKTELYNELRERIVKVVPEIMELKFGCRVKINKGKKGYWGYSKIGLGTIIDTFIGEDSSHSGYDKMQDNVSAILDNGTIRPKFSCSKNQLEILGRDIQLADVLRAMHTNGDEAYFFLTPDGSFVADEFGDGSTFTEIAKWNLALPLHEQSDELGEWLMTVIE